MIPVHKQVLQTIREFSGRDCIAFIIKIVSLYGGKMNHVTTRSLIIGLSVVLCLASPCFAESAPSRYDCGSQAVAHLLGHKGLEDTAAKVRDIPPQYRKGFSVFRLLEMAEPLNLTARQLTLDELETIDLPAIVHFNGAETGHFAILTTAGPNYGIFHPQSGAEEFLSASQMSRAWSGVTLFTSGGGNHPGKPIAPEEQKKLFGGDNEGTQPQPGGDGEGGPPGDCPVGNPACECPVPSGAPRWAVNPVNMNLYVVDTPMTYSPTIGPKVRIKLEYNTMFPATSEEIFGRKWTFQFQSHLSVAANGNVTIVMPDGNRKVYVGNGQGGYNAPYNTFEELVKIADNHYELRFQTGTTYVYAAYSEATARTALSEVKDSHDHALTIGYDSGQISTITDALNQITTLIYNSDGLVERIDDPFGRSATFEYSNGNLSRITDMGGYWTALEYDAANNLAALENAGNRTGFYVEPAGSGVTQLSYPPPGGQMRASRRVTITHPNGGKEEFHYNGAAGYGWRVLPEEYIEYSPEHNNSSADVAKTIYYYAATAKGIREEVASVNYPNGEAVFYAYDFDSGRKIAAYDILGNTTSYTYNSKGNPTSIINPKGSQTEYVYADNDIDVIEISNDLGTIYLEYNEHHDIISFTGLDQKTTTTTYNDHGQIRTVTGPDNVVTEYFYRPDHTLERVERAGLVVGESSYDSAGRLASSTDATGLTLIYGYDDLDHLISITYPDGKRDEMEYSSAQCPQKKTRHSTRSGLTDTYSYNTIQKLDKNINNEGGVLGNYYDLNGNLTNFTDPNGNTTTFSYDANNRLLARIHDDGRGISYVRDGMGRITRRTNARGSETEYYYDENSNLITVEHLDGITPGVTIDYDDYDRITRIEDGSGVYLFTYDEASRIETIDGPWENDTITYSYDDLGRVRTVQVAGGLLRTYSYDTMGRLTQVQVGSQVYAYSFKGPVNPLIETLTLPSGARTEYQYTALNQLSGVINTRSDNQPINSFLYGYDNEDQRSSETMDGVLPLPEMTDRTTDSSFNNLNQLLQSIDPDLVFAYDFDGNMITGYTPEGYTFTALFDADSRLTDISYTDSASVNHHTEFIYRWDGFLAVIRSYENDLSTGETRIIRDGHLALEDRDGDNTVLWQYTWGANLGGGIGGLLGLDQESNHYSYLYDGKGNVVALLDNLQNKVAQYRYNNFGKLVNTAETLIQPFRFSTKRYDSSLGLVYYGYRFYNPSIERWMNRDPLGEDGGINLYGFVENDPVNWVDPWGLWKGFAPGRAGGKHHNRNKHQEGKCPPKRPCEEDNWMSEGKSPTHGGFESLRGTGTNLGYQCVYDNDGNLVTDPEFEGTYDYWPPYQEDGNVLIDVPMHFLNDVFPWIIGGN